MASSGHIKGAVYQVASCRLRRGYPICITTSSGTRHCHSLLFLTICLLDIVITVTSLRSAADGADFALPIAIPNALLLDVIIVMYSACIYPIVPLVCLHLFAKLYDRGMVVMAPACCAGLAPALYSQLTCHVSRVTGTPSSRAFLCCATA